MVITSLLIGMLLVASILTFIALGWSSPIPWLFLLAIAGIVVLSRRREKSHYVTWKEEYSVGIESIDKDHQKLLNLINQFQTAVNYRTGEQFEKEALEAVVDYTITHFKREEDLLEKYEFPGFAEHKAQHQKMIQQVENCMAKHSEERQQSMQYGADFLRDWLINHINGTDKEYSQFLRDKGVR